MKSRTPTPFPFKAFKSWCEKNNIQLTMESDNLWRATLYVLGNDLNSSAVFSSETAPTPELAICKVSSQYFQHYKEQLAKLGKIIQNLNP